MRAITSMEEFDAFLADNSDKLVMVDFFATWCGPCKMIAPKIEAFEKVFDTVMFCKVDVDEAADLAEREGVSAMPTFKFYKGGKQVDELTGANENKIRDLLEKHK